MAGTAVPRSTGRSSSRFGGPDGGNGGHGGSVSLVVDPQVTTLLDFHFHPHVKADNGKGGAGSNRDGANGHNLVLKVPNGTVVQTADGTVLADMVGAGTTFEVARGGRGGRGNASLANARRKAPGFAELGEPGDQLDVVLELKSVADVGPGGLPVGRQVVADLGDLRGQAEDRRLPVHHPGAQPRRGPDGQPHLHRRRRARA